MKRFIAAILTLALLFAACGAQAQGFVLPTPEPAATPAPETEEGKALPDPKSAEEAKPLILPSPSYYLNMPGTLKEGFFTSDGYNADALLYDTVNPGNALSEYLTSCVKAGFSWTPSDDFTGYVAYKITGGEYAAYLVVNYGDQMLFLVEQGMQKEEEMPAPEPDELNRLLLTVNGKSWQMTLSGAESLSAKGTAGSANASYTGEDPSSENCSYSYGGTSEYDFSGFPDISGYSGYNWGPTDWSSYDSSAFDYYSSQDWFSEPAVPVSPVELVFTSQAAPFSSVTIALPRDLQTAQRYTVRAGDNPNRMSFILSRADGSALADLRYYMDDTVGFTSKEDYITVTVIFFSPSENGSKARYQCSFEGRLNGGDTVVSGTFLAEK